MVGYEMPHQGGEIVTNDAQSNHCHITYILF